jgi:hypothetical protein
MCKETGNATTTFTCIDGQLQTDEPMIHRLPQELAQGLIRVAAWKWLKVINQRRNYFSLQLQLGTLYTKIGNLLEKFTRRLFELDGVLTMGNPELRTSRKALVGRIQNTIQLLELNLTRAKKLKAWALDKLAPEGQHEQQADKSLSLNKSVSSVCEGMNSEEEESEEEEDGDSEEGNEESEEDAEDDSDEEYDSEEDHIEETESKEGESEEDESDWHQHVEEHQHQQDAAAQPFKRGRMPRGRLPRGRLPSWSPECVVHQVDRFTHGFDGHLLQVPLPGLDRSQGDTCNVDFEGRQLVLHGEKWPSPQDIMLLQHAGRPNFGSFRLTLDLPSQCSAQGVDAMLSRGSLLVRIPSRGHAHRTMPAMRSPFFQHGLGGGTHVHMHPHRPRSVW